MSQEDVIPLPELDSTPAAAGVSWESRFDSLTSSMEAITSQVARLTSAVALEPGELDLDDAILPPEFDPTESLLGLTEAPKSPEEASLPYEDLFKDSEDCGPKVNKNLAKRIDDSCTKKPAKEQFSNIQKKYLRPENCEFLKCPRVNPELWDDLEDKTKTRDVSFQSFQKNLIKGIIPVVMMVDKVVEAKSRKDETVKLSDIYGLAVDAITLLGNSVYEFSMKRRELLRSEVDPAFKSLCNASQPISTMLFGDELPQCIRNISQVKHMAAKSGKKRRHESCVKGQQDNYFLTS